MSDVEANVPGASKCIDGSIMAQTNTTVLIYTTKTIDDPSYGIDMSCHDNLTDLAWSMGMKNKLKMIARSIYNVYIYKVECIHNLLFNTLQPVALTAQPINHQTGSTSTNPPRRSDQHGCEETRAVGV
jgi:hypothetical protein